MKKLILAVAPIAVAAALFVMPAMASAATTAYGTCATGTPETKPPCKTGEHFTEFTEFKHEPVIDKKVSTEFVLENEAGTLDVDCSSFSSIGYFENIKKVGHSHEILVFDGCKGTGGLKECKINPATNNEIEGVITNVVKSETEVEFTITEGFEVICELPTETKNLGTVTGTFKGTVGASSAIVKFAKAKGLKFAGEASTITGEAETETTSGKKVFIN
jgi:hypothetical protein